MSKFPIVQGERDESGKQIEPPSEETLKLRAQYFASCDELNHHVAELEYIQVEILKLLLINDDNSEVTSIHDCYFSLWFTYLHCLLKLVNIVSFRI